MLEQPSLFDAEPVARTRDPQTSHQAAQSVTKTTRQQLYDAIMYCLATRPMTDNELAEHVHAAGLRFSPSGLRTRRAELVDRWMVKDSGQRVQLPSGRFAIVWSKVL